MNKLTGFVCRLLNTPQAWLFDSTFYCRMGGLAPEKIEPWCHGMLIQSGIGDEIKATMQDQIDVAEELGLEYVIWHIPHPKKGSMRSQAQLVRAQPRTEGRLLIADLEEAERGDPTTLVTPNQGHEFLLELADVSGRPSMGYSNPDTLINKFKMPKWVYDFDWWIAQYPSSSWKYFEQFLQYYKWKYPSYFKNDAEFCKRIKFWQWTQWGKAKHYYSVDK